MSERAGTGEGGPPRGPASRASEPALRLAGVRKIYPHSWGDTAALDGVSLTLAGGTFTAVMGPSGSGKSTLLQCAAGLDRPSDGAVFIDGIELPQTNETARTKFRRGRVGFIFQQFNLLPTLTVLENVALPMRLLGRRPDARNCRAILNRVGLADRIDHRPGELSGGQQQRVAIARALIAQPSIIFADEPTGALDSRSAVTVLELLRETVDDFAQTLVMVTHDPTAAAHADRVLFMTDGRLVDELDQPTVDAVARRMIGLGDDSGRESARQGV